jgi:ribosomal protein S18 acetylase RimI-like enzyme
MSAGAVSYSQGRASAADIARHLERCAADFVPALNDRVDIEAYAAKLAALSVCFEAWADAELVGLVAAYMNDRARGVAFVSSVSVVPGRRGTGIAARLLRDCLECAKLERMKRVTLEVGCENRSAVRLYEALGFGRDEVKGDRARMSLGLEGVAAGA